ncbi:MAG: M28 family peptidase [Bacteroidota bacterium]
MKLRYLLFFLLPGTMLSAQTDSIKSMSQQYQLNIPVKKKKRHYLMADPQPFAQTITAADLKAVLDVLASNAMQGRETGQEGQRKAADFIAKQFKDAGIPAKGDRNSYFQKIMLSNDSWTDIGLKVGDKEYKNRADFYVYPALNPDNPLISTKEVVFVGYGIDDPKYSDYGKADVQGKAVIFYDGEPLDAKGNSLITGTLFRSDWSINWKKKVQIAKTKGATIAFIIDPKIAENLKNNRKLLSSYGWKPVASNESKLSADMINNVFVSPELATAIMGDKAEKVQEAIKDLQAGEKFKAVKIKSKIEVRLDKDSKILEGSNVLAVIEGTDEEMKKEYVFVTAHYDHLGMPDTSVIYHGADDNASGSSGVIAIAKAFQEAKKQGIGPKRTVVCMLVSGEEKGLLGSKYYTEFPVFPLEKTVVDVNIDMIGRLDEKHKDNPNYIYVIGSDRLSPDLHEINERVNEEHDKLELDYKYNAKDDPNHYYERSDHYNFAEKGIPAIFYFNGTHADYHRPTDTADKINFDALAKRAKLAFYTAWEVANRPGRIMIEKKE